MSATQATPSAIPRVFHRIWFGPDPMPEDYVRYGETWRQHHPGWEMRLWNESNLPEPEDREAWARARNHGERSDLLRYQLLLRFGGVYLDTDVECKRSIEPLLEGVTAFAGSVRPGKLGNAILGSVPEHPAFRRALEQASQRVGSGHEAGATGPLLLTRALDGQEGVTIFEPKLFYPFHRRRGPHGRRQVDQAYAIHHVEASWKGSAELREDIRRLRNRVERARARGQAHRRRVNRLKRRARDERRRGQRLRRRAARARKRAAAAERTRWWRARARLVRALAPARSALRGAYRSAAARSARGSGSGVSVSSRRSRRRS